MLPWLVCVLTLENDQQKPTVSFLKLAGPGLVVAATGIGSGDVVSATVGGARYGVVLLWAIVAGAFFKFVLSEGIARWQLATGKTALEGWADHLPAWVKYYFGAYLVLWTVAVSAALTNATGLGISQPHQRRGAAIVGRGCPQPGWLCVRVARRLRQLREVHEAAGRRDGLQHPAVRGADAARIPVRWSRAC